MKRTCVLLICLLFLLLGIASAQASGLTIIPAPEATFEPFLVETGELAVNVRETADEASAEISRIERGQQLTVVGEIPDENGIVWYEVLLEGGMSGYIRSDLLMTAEEAEAERAAAPVPQDEKLIGNRKTKKYHEPWCHSLPKEANRVYFDTSEEEGYVHCQNCD